MPVASPIYSFIFIVVKYTPHEFTILTIYSVAPSNPQNCATITSVPELSSPQTCCVDGPQIQVFEEALGESVGLGQESQEPWETPTRPLGQLVSSGQAPLCLLSLSLPPGKLHTQHMETSFQNIPTPTPTSTGSARKYASLLQPWRPPSRRYLLAGKEEGVCPLSTLGARASGPPSPGLPGTLAGSCSPRLSPGEWQEGADLHLACLGSGGGRCRGPPRQPLWASTAGSGQETCGKAAVLQASPAPVIPWLPLVCWAHDSLQ